MKAWEKILLYPIGIYLWLTDHAKKVSKFVGIKAKPAVAILVAVTMMLSLMPMNVFALPATHSHPICGTSCAHNGAHTAPDSGWTAWTKINSKTAGNYYLTESVDLQDGTWEFPESGTVNLCLNGFTLDLGETDGIVVNPGVTLNICDCSEGGTGIMTVTGDNMITNGGTVNVYGGTLQYNGSSAIVKNYGTFNLYGGAVENIYTGTGMGIENCIDEENSLTGNVNIYGGSVSAGFYPIVNDGTMTISGGTVSATNGNGWCIDNSGTLTVSGGSVFSPNCGIENSGTLTISGSAQISGGTNAGILNQGTKSSLTVTGGTISNCIAHQGGSLTVSGGTIDAIESATSFTLSGAPTISGVSAADIGTVGIFLLHGCTITVGEDGLTNTTPYSVATAATPTASSPVTIVEANDSDYSANFKSAADGYQVLRASDNTLQLAVQPTHSHPVCGDSSCSSHSDAVTYTAWDGTGSTLGTSSQTKSVYLSASPSARTGDLTVSGTVNLCLNGQTLDLGATRIVVSSGATLNLCDCGSTGKITSSDRKTIQNKGTVNIYSGTVECTSTESGACAIDSETILNVTGGTVSATSGDGIGNTGSVSIGGTANISAGDDGIYDTSETGTITVSGNASISGGDYGINNNYGGDITVSGNVRITGTDSRGIDNVISNLTITGGTISGGDFGVVQGSTGNLSISGNTSISGTGTYGSGVWFYGTGTFTLSGAPAISGVESDWYCADIYLAEGKTITIGEGGLSNTVPYSVSTGTSPSVGTPDAVTAGTETADYSDKFTVIDADKHEITSVNNEGKYQVFLAKKPTPISGTLTLSGTEKFGETLTASYTGTETVTYQWYRGEEPISGATGQTYTLTVEDLGKVITVKVTGTGNYAGEKTASTSSWVSKADLPTGIVTAQGYTGTYDENAHGITVDAPDGAVVKYGTSMSNCNLDESPKYTDFGTYTVYFQVSIEGYNTFTSSRKVTISKADPTYDAPTAKENLVYTGIEKSLVNSGSATGGTMQYAIGTQTAPTTSFSTYIPVGKGAGTYYVWYKVLGDSNHNDVAPICVTVTIAKATLTVTAKNKTITYGDAPANDGVTYTGFVGTDNETALKGTLEYDYSYTQFGDVGDYEIIPDGLSADNYEIIFHKGTLTVSKKEIGIDWSNTALIYNGTAQKPTATATGTVNGDVLTLTVGGEQTNVSDTAYTATVTGISGTKAGNYKLPTNVTTDFTISYLAAKPEMYSVIAAYEKDGVYWFMAEDIVTIAAGTGYQISTAANGTFGDSVTFGGNDTFRIYIKDTNTGTFTDVIDLSSILMTDALLPGGEIKIDERNAWQSFVNTITFNLFFKDEKTATVTVNDYNESGIKSVECFLANDLPDLSGEKNEAVAKLEAVVQAAGGWKIYTAPVGLNANAQNLLFVKIIDNVGRVAYLNSQGIVLDSIAPTLHGIENGGVYYGDKIFKANDDNFDKIEVDGNDITNTAEGDDEYKIVADNAEHTVTVTDKAGNVTEYKITVYKNYTVTFKVDGETLTTETVGYGKDATLPSIPEKEGYTQTAPVWDKDGKNITADTEINAVYTVNKYTVTFKADGEVVGTLTVEHGKDATAPTIPAKDGYTQTAPVWDKDGKNITDDTEINAVYTINEYTITFMDENGVYKTLTYKHGETVTMPDVPTKDGYTVKWETTIDKSTADATIKAVYTEIPKTDTPSSPQTGDNSHLSLWILLLIISGGAVITLTVVDRKKKAAK